MFKHINELQEEINLLNNELNKIKSLYLDKRIKFKFKNKEIIAKVDNFYYNSTCDGDKLKVYLEYENISQAEINKLNLEDIFGYITLSKFEKLNIKMLS